MKGVWHLPRTNDLVLVESGEGLCRSDPLASHREGGVRRVGVLSKKVQ